MDKYLSIVNYKNEITDEIMSQFEFTNNVKVNMGDRGKDSSFVEKETYEHFLKLQQELKKHGLDVTINSAGRDVLDQKATQDEMYNLLIKKGKTKEEAQTWVDEHVAKPGFSEHHLGLAIDCRVKYDKLPDCVKKNKILKKVVMIPTDKIAKQIFKKYLSDFGFILRYDAKHSKVTGVDEEDWHIRYVGKENAKDIESKKMCLEEYVDYLKSLEEKLCVD